MEGVDRHSQWHRCLYGMTNVNAPPLPAPAHLLLKSNIPCVSVVQGVQHGGSHCSPGGGRIALMEAESSPCVCNTGGKWNTGTGQKQTHTRTRSHTPCKVLQCPSNFEKCVYFQSYTTLACLLQKSFQKYIIGGFHQLVD